MVLRISSSCITSRVLSRQIQEMWYRLTDRQACANSSNDTIPSSLISIFYNENRRYCRLMENRPKLPGKCLLRGLVPHRYPEYDVVREAYCIAFHTLPKLFPRVHSAINLIVLFRVMCQFFNKICIDEIQTISMQQPQCSVSAQDPL